jgi:hypothetical protein
MMLLASLEALKSGGHCLAAVVEDEAEVDGQVEVDAEDFALDGGAEANFFIFILNLKQILNLTAFENIFKSNPFGPATMHGGANALNPAMHGGGVKVPRGTL